MPPNPLSHEPTHSSPVSPESDLPADVNSDAGGTLLETTEPHHDSTLDPSNKGLASPRDGTMPPPDAAVNPALHLISRSGTTDSSLRSSIDSLPASTRPGRRHPSQRSRRISSTDEEGIVKKNGHAWHVRRSVGNDHCLARSIADKPC